MHRIHLARLGLPGLCFSIAVLLGCTSEDSTDVSGADVLPVTAVSVALKEVPFVVETVGRAEGSKAVEVRARITGILEQQTYNEGETVKAGQVLFKIDPAPFEIALQHARAAVAQESARHEQAKRNAERLSGLAKQNAVSRRVADDAQSELDHSEAALLAAQANVREAELNLSYTQVTAPIGGISGRALRSEGSLLNAGSESALLTTLTQADPMWVRFALSESEYAALRAAESANPKMLSVAVLHRNGEVRSPDGRLNFTASTLDESLGTVQLRAEFPNQKLTMLPGEYVRVRLSGGSRKTLTVPQQAVLQNAKGPFVWVVRGGKAQQQQVTTAAWIGAEWEITSGLNAGDQVIVDQLLKLEVDQPVEVQAQSELTPSAHRQARADAASQPS